jgi:hypothetical protein
MLQTYQLEKHQNQGVDVLEISEVLDKEFDRKVSVIEPTHKREREREREYNVKLSFIHAITYQQGVWH